MIKVSVIIPYFKKKRFITKTLKSVLNQSYKNLEIIIIYDDPNLDELEFILKKFNKFKNIKFLINKKNFGAAISRNRGIKCASGTFCAFIDADDIWHKSKVSEQLNFMIKNKYDFSFTYYQKKIKKKIIIVKESNSYLTYFNLLRNCNVGLSTVMIKKNKIPKNFFPNTKTQEDLGAWLKYLQKNYKIHNFKKILTVWTDAKGSLSKNTVQKIRDLITILNNQKNITFLNKIKFFFCIVLNSIKRKH